MADRLRTRVSLRSRILRPCSAREHESGVDSAGDVGQHKSSKQSAGAPSPAMPGKLSAEWTSNGALKTDFLWHTCALVLDMSPCIHLVHTATDPTSSYSDSLSRYLPSSRTARSGKTKNAAGTPPFSTS
jgi:hypothetical protein